MHVETNLVGLLTLWTVVMTAYTLLSLFVGLPVSLVIQPSNHPLLTSILKFLLMTALVFVIVVGIFILFYVIR